MFTKVVVGVDGRTGGRDAIALAQQLVGEGGELTLANVYFGGRLIRRPANETYEALQREDGLELLEKQRAWTKLDAQLRTLGSPSVARGLHEIVESARADLLVVGSCHRGRLGHVFIGDDTSAALSRSPCPVAVAPAGYVRSQRSLHEIGVGYDGSPESEQALAVGRQLAAENGAKLSALEVVSLPTQEYLAGVDNFGSAIERVVEKAHERLVALGGVEPRAVYGIPARELAGYSHSVDLLVIGSRDRGPAGQLVLGSTSHSLARSAGCPLLVVGRSAKAAGLGLDETVLEGVVNELGA